MATGASRTRVGSAVGVGCFLAGVGMGCTTGVGEGVGGGGGVEVGLESSVADADSFGVLVAAGELQATKSNSMSNSLEKYC